MSTKFDYKKDLKESAIDAAILTTGVLTLAWAGSKAGVSKPTLSPTPENIAKIAVYLAATDMLKDYAKSQKWI